MHEAHGEHRLDRCREVHQAPVGRCSEHAKDARHAKTATEGGRACGLPVEEHDIGVHVLRQDDGRAPPACSRSRAVSERTAMDSTISHGGGSAIHCRTSDGARALPGSPRTSSGMLTLAKSSGSTRVCPVRMRSLRGDVSETALTASRIAGRPPDHGPGRLRGLLRDRSLPERKYVAAGRTTDDHLLSVVEKLSAAHDLTTFDCGVRSLDMWLKRFALAN